MATSKEDDFRQRFAALLLDLSTSDDTELTALLGSLGTRIISHAGVPTWAGLKQNLTRQDYDGLLKTFQAQGNDLARIQRHVEAAKDFQLSLAFLEAAGDILQAQQLTHSAAPPPDRAAPRATTDRSWR